MGGRSRARAGPSGARRLLLRRRRRSGWRRRMRDGEVLGLGRSVAARCRGSLRVGGDDRRVSALGCRRASGGAGGSRPRPDWFRTRTMGSERDRPPPVLRGGLALRTEWIGTRREHVRLGWLERACSHATPRDSSCVAREPGDGFNTSSVSAATVATAAPPAPVRSTARKYRRDVAASLSS